LTVLGLRWRFWLFVLVVAALTSAASLAMFIFWSNLGAPIEIIEQQDVGHIVQNDGRLWIHFRVLRTRTCLADASHFLVNEILVDGKPEPVVIPVVQDGPVPFEGLGISVFTLSVPLPTGVVALKAGSPWRFITKRIDTCGPFGRIFPHSSQTEPLPINVDQLRAAPGVPVTSAVRPGAPKTVISNSPIATQGPGR
jgi:hypothetical protein